MATKIASISDFLKGFLMGAWIAITERPNKAQSVLNEVMQKRRKTDADNARTISEIGFIPPRK